MYVSCRLMPRVAPQESDPSKITETEAEVAWSFLDSCYCLSLDVQIYSLRVYLDSGFFMEFIDLIILSKSNGVCLKLLNFVAALN